MAATRTIDERIEDLELIIVGNSRLKIIGLQDEVEEIKKAVKEWRDMKLTLRGMWLGIGVTGLVGFANLVTTLSQIGQGIIK